MALSRLHALPDNDLARGQALLIGPGADADLAVFDPDRTQVVQHFFSDHKALADRGFQLVDEPQGQSALAVVFAPRSRDLARARIAQAVAHLPEGAPLWIDGLKGEGIDSLLREIRGLLPVDEVHSRAHGKIFRVTLPGQGWLPAGWVAADIQAAPGMVTRPGVFSADGPDPGSLLLAQHLPDKLPARIVDLGAGWGWLSAQILTRPSVQVLHLVEADKVALDCARRNISDPRAVFHWADALAFSLPEPVNGVIMNPPFHQSRVAEPRLGAGFIQTAARLLTGAGRLWMVANRHLPYEEPLRAAFADVQELGGDSRFKILTATGAGRGSQSRRGRRG